MRLFLLRHGKAEPYTVRDETRQLVEHGREQTAQVAQDCLAGVKFDAIWASPFVRAQQTAHIVLDVIKKAQPDSTLSISTINGVTPDDSPRKAIDFFSGHEAETILLVSHQPFLGCLAGLLIEGNLQAAMDLHTSGLVELSMDVVGLGQANLIRYVAPK